nr:MAG TPA_asm: hypothetical protein [Bacteriophage sp.]
MHLYRWLFLVIQSVVISRVIDVLNRKVLSCPRTFYQYLALFSPFLF